MLERGFVQDSRSVSCAGQEGGGGAQAAGGGGARAAAGGGGDPAERRGRAAPEGGGGAQAPGGGAAPGGAAEVSRPRGWVRGGAGCLGPGPACWPPCAIQSWALGAGPAYASDVLPERPHLQRPLAAKGVEQIERVWDSLRC